MIDPYSSDLFFAMRVGSVLAYALTVGGLVFVTLWGSRRFGSRAARVGAWRLDALLASVAALVTGLAVWFGRSWPTDPATVPAIARRCVATANGAQWRFELPGEATPIDGVLWAVVDQPVQVLLQNARDVREPRCFAVPAMRVHGDTVPARYQSVWFTPIELGDFPIAPARDCPHAAHSPRATLRVVDAMTFARAPWRR